jgi:hypothetical protein
MTPDKIIKIVDLGIKKTTCWDVSVKDTNNFFANGLLVHNCQNFSHWFTDPANLEHKYEITIKEDGSSITAFKKDNLLGVCSRNLCVWKQHIGFFSKLFGFKKFVRSEFYEIAQQTNLIKALQKLNMNIAVQGEFVGPGKNGNRSLRTNLDIYVFDIWLIDEMRYASVDERKTIFQKLQKLKLMLFLLPLELWL